MVAKYEPVIDTAVWLAIRDFVTAAVSDCAGSTPYNESTLNVATSRLTAWCWEDAGLPLERTVIFDRNTIAHFIAVGSTSWSPSARGNLRSQLLRMSETLIGRTTSLRRLVSLPPPDPSLPYIEEEIVALRNWAQSQSTPHRRSNARTLLALGFGVGLSASELGDLRSDAVHVDGSGVAITVEGARARTVPVLRAWEQDLVDRLSLLRPGQFVFRENRTMSYPNHVSNFVNRSQKSAIQPQTQRLRATWIVHHLTVGTPVKALMRAAGVESLEAFTRYMRFVPDVDVELARALLR